MRFLLCIALFAIPFMQTDIEKPFFEKSFLQKSNLSFEIYPKGLIFSAIYDGDIDADEAKGHPLAIFTADREGATESPGTYFDSAGVMQLQTATSNTTRYNSGYYDTTGYHAFSQQGVLLEGASTNDLSKSEEFEHGDWTKTNITADDTDAGSTAPDGAAQTSSLTATAGNGTLVQSFADAGANVYTASVWIKRKTGSGTINLRANSGDGYTAITATSEWTRHKVTSSALANPDFDLQIVTNTDAIYIHGAQLENLPLAFSYIPTTTAALTRNKETLEYKTSGNRSAAVESMVAKLAPAFDSSGSVVYYVSDTDTKQRKAFLVSNDFRIEINGSDSSDSKIINIINDTWTAHTEMTLGYAAEKGGSPIIAGYWDGAADGTNETADDFIVNAWGTFFQVGISQGGGASFYGTVFSVGFWDRALNAIDMKSLHDTDWRKLRVR